MTGECASAGAGAKKEQALRLFAGLPRRYDAAGASSASARTRAGEERWWPRWTPGRTIALESQPGPAWSRPPSCVATAAAW